MADVIIVLHFAFVLFVLFGGLLALAWPRIVWLHVPSVVWGVMIEFTGWICPLTPLENMLRRQDARPEYQGDFIARYILPVLYPEGLTRNSQFLLGSIALAFNVGIYALIVLRRRRSARKDI